MHYNMVNEAMNAKKSVINPEVRMGATMFVGSDRYAMVVTHVLSPKRIVVAHIFDCHENIFEKDENGIEWMPKDVMNMYFNSDKPYNYHEGHVYTYRKNKRWMPLGDDMWGTGSIHVGHAENYRDPSF